MPYPCESKVLEGWHQVINVDREENDHCTPSKKIEPSDEQQRVRGDVSAYLEHFDREEWIRLKVIEHG